MKARVNGHDVDLGALPRFDVRSGEGVLHVKTAQGSRTALAVRHRGRILVSFLGNVYEIEPAGRARAGAGHSTGELRAAMPGLVVDVLVSEGERVEEGQRLLVLEAMKTQQPLLAPFDGLVETLAARPGEQVAEGALLALVSRVENAEIQSE